MTAAGKKHLLTVLNYPGAGHLIEPPFSPHCRVARLNKKSTSCSCQEKALPSHLLTQDALTEVCVCVCFSYIGARGTNQTSLRRPGGCLVEDLGLPTASSVLHSLRQHGEEQRNKKNLSSRRLWPLHLSTLWHSSSRKQQRYDAELLRSYHLVFSCYSLSN